MGKHRRFLLLFTCLLVTFVTSTNVIKRAANMEKSQDFWSLNEDDRIMLFANMLADNRENTDRLFNMYKSLQWLMDATNGNPQGQKLMPAVLDSLPWLLQHNLTKLVTLTTLDEVSRVDVPQNVIDSFKQRVASAGVNPNSPAFAENVQKLATQYTLSNTNWFRAVRRILMRINPRDYLADQSQSNNNTVNPQCLNDTMDFINAIPGTELHLTHNMTDLNFTDYNWVMTMLDSFGKPSGGILKGAVHFVGSYEQCHSVHAYIPADPRMTLGSRLHDYTTEFDTHFCRVTFNLPQGFTEGLGVNTRGITLRLHWGMCFPDTCHSHDVASMLQLPLLEYAGLTVHTVLCAEEEKLEEDASAIVAIVVLACLTAIAVLCTLIEAWITFYNNNFATSTASTYSTSIEERPDVVYENAAYESAHEVKEGGSIGKPAAVPQTSKGDDGVMGLGYVPHKEGVPTFNDHNGATENKSHAPEKLAPPPYTPPVRAMGNQPKESGIIRVIKAFSILTNMPKILSGKKSANSIHCLHGIRFFSILWIMLGHTYNYGVINVTENPTTENLVDADKLFKRFTYQGVMAAGFGVDTFFLLSGFLVTYLTLKDMGKTRRRIQWFIYWVMYYVHRFWRLTPIYMIVLMMFSCLYTYLGDGPLWPEHLPTASNCKTNWWTNLLYVNNFVKVDDTCMGWTWYLANDMQFYWISPIFLPLLFFFPPGGIILVAALAAGGIASSFYQEWKYRGDLFSMHEDSGFWDEVYIKPWCRVSPYAVGMILGYVFYKYKRTTLKLPVAAVGWLWTWAVGVLLCYITYTKRREDGVDWPHWFEAAYEAFGRPLWAMCVAWIIYACHNNRGGFINSILSWEGFLPFSRLTYAAYLLHPIIMMLHAFNWKSLIYIDDFNMVYLFMGHTVTTFMTAFVFSLLFEAPALALEKLIFRLH